MFVLFTIGVSGLMGFVFLENGNRNISKIIINIDRKTEKGFLSAEKIKTIIEQKDSLLSRKVKDINTVSIEKTVKQNVYVEHADVYLNMDKNIVVNILEKKPLIRIYTKNGNGFYVGESGEMFPLSPNFTARVLIANGYINAAFNKKKATVFDTVYQNTHLTDLFELTHLIKKNKFLNAQISQVYVNSKGEYDLIPELGEHLIRIGSIEDAQEKLERLVIWYKKAFVKEGGEQFSVISLKFKDQVVCTKK